MKGLSFSEIGTELGISKQAAHKLVEGAMAETKIAIAERADDLRVLWAERLEAMATAILPAALEGDLAAHDRLIKLADRFSRLTGLDLRPPDVEAGVQIFVSTARPWELDGADDGALVEGQFTECDGAHPVPERPALGAGSAAQNSAV